MNCQASFDQIIHSCTRRRIASVVVQVVQTSSLWVLLHTDETPYAKSYIYAGIEKKNNTTNYALSCSHCRLAMTKSRTAKTRTFTLLLFACSCNLNCVQICVCISQSMSIIFSVCLSLSLSLVRLFFCCVAQLVIVVWIISVVVCTAIY